MHGEEEEGQLDVAGEEGGKKSTLRWGCAGESPEKTDVKPESFLKEDYEVGGEKGILKRNLAPFPAPLEQHSSGRVHLVLSLGDSSSEFLLLLETSICWGIFLGIIASF